MTPKNRNPWTPFAGQVLVAPSLLACDFMRLGEQVQAVTDAGTAVLHVDVMDGHFVPNLALSPGIVESVRAGSDRLLDVHLMLTNPLRFVEPFAKAGADSITFHIEAEDDPRAVIDRLRERGLGVGVVVKPGTAGEALAPYAGEVDLVLIMTVEPGFGGQSFMAEQLDKIRAVRDMVGPDVRVEVDGGIDERTGPLCVQAGADTLVIGSNIFRASDPGKAFGTMARAADAARGG